VIASICLSVCLSVSRVWVMTLALMGLKVKVRLRDRVSVQNTVDGTGPRSSIEHIFLVY